MVTFGLLQLKAITPGLGIRFLITPIKYPYQKTIFNYSPGVYGLLSGGNSKIKLSWEFGIDWDVRNKYNADKRENETSLIPAFRTAIIGKFKIISRSLFVAAGIWLKKPQKQPRIFGYTLGLLWQKNQILAGLRGELDMNHKLKAIALTLEVSYE